MNQQFCKTFNPLNNIFIHFARWDDETAKVDIHQKSNIYDNLDTDDYETKQVMMTMTTLMMMTIRRRDRVNNNNDDDILEKVRIQNGGGSRAQRV